jgi:hypothetical protein
MRATLTAKMAMAAFGLLFAPIRAVFGQQVIGTQAGTIDYLQGKVLLDGTEMAQLCGSCSVQMKDGQHLRTANGRAEVLLAPKVTLWLDRNSSFQMDQTALKNTKLTLEQGSALIEIVQRVKGNRIEVQVGTSFAAMDKMGVYRFDSATLRVYGGEAIVTRGNSKAVVKRGKAMNLQNNPAPADFDAKADDPLHDWAAQRSFDLFMRNETTREQMNWTYLGAGWLWNYGFQMKLHSELYQEFLEQERKRRAHADTELWKNVPSRVPDR